MSTPLAVTVRLDGFPEHPVHLSDGDVELHAQQAITHDWLWLGMDEFPATQLWSDDIGQALIETKSGQPCLVQTIDLEYLNANDAWIDKYFNPICLGCWYWTCQTILKEGDKRGEAYSVRLVDDEQCEAPFHNEED